MNTPTLNSLIANAPATDLPDLGAAELTVSPITHLGLLEVTGADRLSFLQGQFTQDMLAIAPDQSRLAGYCTPKGRLLAVLRAYHHGDTLGLLLATDTVEAVQKRLSMFVLRAKVKLTPVEARLFGFSGKGAAAALESLTGSAPPSVSGAVQTGPGWAVIAYPDTTTPRWLLVQAADGPLLDVALPDTTTIGADAYWRWLDIRDGLPLLSTAVADAFVPQMVNLDALDGIDFQKGCYAGQEIVARTHYLGKVKRRMYLGHITSGQTAPGEKLLNAEGREAGQVVASQSAPGGGVDALVVLRREQVDAGKSSLSVDNALLEIQELPYPFPADREPG